MRRTRWLFVSVLLLTASCGGRPELVPSPEASLVEGDPLAARRTVAGVTVTAEPGAWAGRPASLRVVTPVLVTLDNRGAAPLLVRYSELALEGPSGERFAALPPYDIEGTATGYESAGGPSYPMMGFSVAPYASRYFPFYGTYGGDFFYDRSYYGTYYSEFKRIGLPTSDMVQKALPEGVVDPGGKVQGFIYFQNVAEGLRQVEFRYELVHANSGERFGIVKIPFRIRN